MHDDVKQGARLEHATDVHEFISDLGGGAFEQKLGVALSDVAAGVVDNDSTGKVTVVFTMKRIGNSASVVVAHKLSTKRPTANGDRSENNTTNTPMHVITGGKLQLYPMGAPTNDMFNKPEEVPEHSE